MLGNSSGLGREAPQGCNNLVRSQDSRLLLSRRAVFSCWQSPLLSFPSTSQTPAPRWSLFNPKTFNALSKQRGKIGTLRLTNGTEIPESSSFLLSHPSVTGCVDLVQDTNLSDLVFLLL